MITCFSAMPKGCGGGGGGVVRKKVLDAQFFHFVAPPSP